MGIRCRRLRSSVVLHFSHGQCPPDGLCQRPDATVGLVDNTAVLPVHASYVRRVSGRKTIRRRVGLVACWLVLLVLVLVGMRAQRCRDGHLPREASSLYQRRQNGRQKDSRIKVARPLPRKQPGECSGLQKTGWLRGCGETSWQAWNWEHVGGPKPQVDSAQSLALAGRAIFPGEEGLPTAVSGHVTLHVTVHAREIPAPRKLPSSSPPPSDGHRDCSCSLGT
ncbi:hypothetical protein HDV57DRAFT_384477 [Trichoderma longibrachiatum]